jgi:hypothetical protein
MVHEDEVKKISEAATVLVFGFSNPEQRVDGLWYSTETPSGDSCEFLTKTNQCILHSLNLKPKYCIEFPLEDGKPSPMAIHCPLTKQVDE